MTEPRVSDERRRNPRDFQDVQVLDAIHMLGPRATALAISSKAGLPAALTREILFDLTKIKRVASDKDNRRDEKVWWLT